MQAIIPNLWFDGNAEEAVNYYVSVFPDSEIKNVSHYPEDGLADFQKNMAGKVLVIDFKIKGMDFAAINAGSEFTFNESVSFSVACEDQAEIDTYWDKLSAVPESEQCGWCKDKFGVSWQIVPKNIDQLIARPNGFEVMSNQHKIIISEYK